MTSRDLKRYLPRASVALLILVAFAITRRGEPAKDAPPPLESVYGEALLHGAAPPGVDVSYLLPMATIGTALMFSHDRPPPWRRWLAWAGCAAIFLALAGYALRTAESWTASAVLLVLGWQLAGADGDWYRSYALLVTLAAGLLAWRAQDPSFARSLALALAVGATLLYRSPLAFFPPLLVLFERLTWPRAALRSHWKHAAILLLVPYAFLAPWIWMNWVLHRQFIPFENGEANGIIVTAAVGRNDKLQGGSRDPFLGPSPDDRRLAPVLSWAAATVGRDPLRYAAGYGRRAWLVFLIHPWLVCLALVSAWASRSRKGIAELVLLALYYAWIHCFMAVKADYFAPLWPLLAALAAAPLLSLEAHAPPPQPRKAEAVAGPVMLLFLGLVLIGCAGSAWVVGAYASKAARRDQFSDAALAEAFAAGPPDAWLLLERGRRGLAAGRAKEAVADLQDSLILQPGREDLALLLAVARHRAGRDEEISNWEPPADDSSLAAVTGCLYKALLRLKQGRREEARRLLSRVVAMLGDEGIRGDGSGAPPGASVLDGLSFRSQEIPDQYAALRLMPSADRLSLLREMTALAPGRLDVRLEEARLAAETGDRGLAAASLKRAVELKPSADDLLAIALAYQRIKAYGPALAVFRRLARDHPSRADYRAGLGVCEYLAGSADQARADLEAALALDAGFLAAYLSLGTIEVRARRFDRAVSVYDRALSSRGFGAADPSLRELIRRSREEAAQAATAAPRDTERRSRKSSKRSSSRPRLKPSMERVLKSSTVKEAVTVP